MKYELIIDATGYKTILHLVVNNCLIDQFTKMNNRDLTISLSMNVQNILSKNNIDISQLSSLYLVYGPGKFSATRTSAILVKTFKMRYPRIKILILDKFNYFASDNTLVVLKSDGSKYFINYFEKKHDKLNPMLVDDNQLQQLMKSNPNWKIANEEYYELDVITTLTKFKEVDEYFVLEYFKLPC